MKKESHYVRGGLVQVFRRERSRFWQCAASFSGQRMRASTEEESLEKAKEFAEDWYDRLYKRHRKGILKFGGENTFAEAAEGFVYEYTAHNQRSRSEKWLRSHEIKLRLHLLPYFGKMPVEDITAASAQEYRSHRMTLKDEKNPLAKDKRALSGKTSAMAAPTAPASIAKSA